MSHVRAFSLAVAVVLGVSGCAPRPGEAARGEHAAADGAEHPGKAVYDAGEDLWIVADPKHTGPGFGFIAVRSDKSFFTGVVPARVFQ